MLQSRRDPHPNTLVVILSRTRCILFCFPLLHTWFLSHWPIFSPLLFLLVVWFATVKLPLSSSRYSGCYAQTVELSQSQPNVFRVRDPTSKLFGFRPSYEYPSLLLRPAPLVCGARLCVAQSVDPQFVQTMRGLLRKAWIYGLWRAIHRLSGSMVCT